MKLKINTVASRKLNSILARARASILIISFFLLLSAMAFWKTGIVGLIDPSETGVGIYPVDYALRFGGAYLWQPIGFFGIDFTQGAPMILYHGSFALLYLVSGLSVDIVQRIWVISIFALQGLGMYFLVSNIVGGRGSRAPAIIAGVFYMYNPWNIALMNSGAVGIYNVVLAMTPVFLALFIKGTNAECGQMKYVLALGFISLTQIFGIQLFLDQMLLVVFYFLFHIALKPSKKKLIQSLRFAAGTIVVILLLNLWWVIPSIASYSWIYTQQVGNIINRGVGDVHYINVFRVWGISWPFPEYYNSTLGIFVGLLLAAFAYIPLLLGDIKTKVYQYILFFTCLSVILTIFSAGDISPFGPLYKWAVLDLPLGIVIFPQNSSKWLPDLLFAYSFLVGVGSMVIVEKIWRLSGKIRVKRLLSKTLEISLIIIILINANSLLSGNLNGITTPVQIPDYYHSTRDWLASDPTEFRFFVVPSPYIQGQTKYLWAPCTMVDPLSQMPKPMISDHPASALIGADIVRLVQNDIYQNSSHAAKILGLIGVKYVMVRTDIDPSYHGLYDYETIKTNLLKSGDFIAGPSFGAWTFFENKWFSPMIFPAQNSFSVVGNISALLPLSEMNLDLNSSAIFFLNDLNSNNVAKALNSSDFVFINENEPALTNEILRSGLPQIYPISFMPSQVNILKEGNYILTSIKPSDGNKALLADFTPYRLSPTQTVYLTSGLHNFTFGTDFLGSSDITGYNGMQLETQSLESKDFVTGFLNSPIPTTYGIRFDCSQSLWNLTSTESINLSLYVNNTKDAGIGINIEDENGNWKQWTIPIPAVNSWSELALPPNIREGIGQQNIDLSKVKSLLFYVVINSAQKDSYQFMIRSVMGGEHTILMSANSENQPLSQLFSKQNNTTLNFTTVNPTLYKVKVSTNSPFVLVFDNSYAPMWKAYINGKEITPFEINSYANGYFINESGDYELTIEFIPQRYLVIGSLVSIIAAVIIVSIASFITLRTRFKKIQRIFSRLPYLSVISY
jgi:hypothetical protein